MTLSPTRRPQRWTHALTLAALSLAHLAWLEDTPLLLTTGELLPASTEAWLTGSGIPVTCARCDG